MPDPSKVLGDESEIAAAYTAAILELESRIDALALARIISPTFCCDPPNLSQWRGVHPCTLSPSSTGERGSSAIFG